MTPSTAQLEGSDCLDTSSTITRPNLLDGEHRVGAASDGVLLEPLPEDGSQSFSPLTVSSNRAGIVRSADRCVT